MARFNVEMILELVDRATGPLKRVGAGLKALGGEGGEKLLEATERRQAAFRTEALEIAATGWALHRALQPAMKFEAAMADVAKVVEFTGETGLGDLGKQLGRLSTRVSISAEGLAQIAAAAGAGGLIDAALPDGEKTAQLLAFAEAAAKMGVAFGMSADQAGASMAGLRAIFQLDQAGVESLADAVNHVTANLGGAAPVLLQVLERAGATTKIFGLTEAQAAALAGTLLKLKVPAEVAGTGINSILTLLKTAPKNKNKAFHATLAKLGYSAEGLAKSIGKDAQGALLDFLRTVRGSDDVLGDLTDLFGLEYGDDVARLVAGLDEYEKAVGLVADQTSYAGSMQREFEVRSKVTEDRLQRLGNAMEFISITLGSVFLPGIASLSESLVPLVDQLGRWAEANPGIVMGIGAALAGLVALRGAIVVAGLLFGGLLSTFIRVWRALALVRLALIATGAFLIGNPIVAGIMLLAGAAYLLWSNWEPIKQFFIDLWQGVKDAFAGAWAYIEPIVSKIAAATSGLRGFASGSAPAQPARFGGGRASGGPVRRGWSYLVGEDGPEFVTFGASGTVHPFDRRPPVLAPAARAGGGGGLSVGDIHVHAAPGQDPHSIARAVLRLIEEKARGAGGLHDGAHYGGRPW